MFKDNQYGSAMGLIISLIALAIFASMAYNMVNNEEQPSNSQEDVLEFDQNGERATNILQGLQGN